jgi:hypothetical protein
MTPEGAIKAKIDDVLKAHGAYYLKPVQNGMGAPGLDYHGIHAGLGFAVEAKAPGKEPTIRQWRTIRAIEKAGGKVFIVDDMLTLAVLNAWLHETKGRPICLTEQ